MNTFEFSKIMKNEISKNIDFIIYRSVKENESYNDIINDIKNNENIFKNIVIVGNSKNKQINTNELIQKIKEKCNVSIGSVLLYERKNELQLCKKRIELGISFFITQIVTNPTSVKQFLDEIPVKIWVTIVPINNQKTLNMICWLCRSNTPLNINIEMYPKELIEFKFENICFESITKIDSSIMVQFIKKFISFKIENR